MVMTWPLKFLKSRRGGDSDGDGDGNGDGGGDGDGDINQPHCK